MRWYWEPGHYKSALGEHILERIIHGGRILAASSPLLMSNLFLPKYGRNVTTLHIFAICNTRRRPRKRSVRGNDPDTIKLLVFGQTQGPYWHGDQATAPIAPMSAVHAVAKFAQHFNPSPDRLGPEKIRAYQIHLTMTGISWAGFNVAVCALRPLRATAITLGRTADGSSAEIPLNAREATQAPATGRVGDQVSAARDRCGSSKREHAPEVKPDANRPSSRAGPDPRPAMSGGNADPPCMPALHESRLGTAGVSPLVQEKLGIH